MLDRAPGDARPIRLRLNGGEGGIVVSCNVSGLEAFNPNRYRRGFAALPFQATANASRDVPAMNSQELEQALPCSGYPIRKSTGQSARTKVVGTEGP
jgi:hypothetical protein